MHRCKISRAKKSKSSQDSTRQMLAPVWRDVKENSPTMDPTNMVPSDTSDTKSDISNTKSDTSNTKSDISDTKSETTNTKSNTWDKATWCTHGGDLHDWQRWHHFTPVKKFRCQRPGCGFFKKCWLKCESSETTCQGCHVIGHKRWWLWRDFCSCSSHPPYPLPYLAYASSKLCKFILLTVSEAGQKVLEWEGKLSKGPTSSFFK